MLYNRILLVVLLLLNSFLVYRLLVSDQGVFAYLELKGRYESLEERITELDQRNLELSQEIRLLKSDRFSVENILRQQMNFVKDDEILYVFPEESTPEAPADAAEQPPGAGNASQN
ncbi:FtsB family cell division protein [Oceanidesulfovibrio marinus]|uniref:Septum formation initiator family protein n=1 Tax=Oceanidesulfovibrio marinus TaxID=370038 RepID=A0A6P1ZM38_9BACT|nr:septum formation initiator family protein [Oceanidesulfovibrio marinus]QJT08223.1 septum formation initiator family protein [Oceanidesulfovibrio marinus]TVM35118.1 septum formation initiator family protein [Oceanidesulfovibrio marinus]